MRYVDDGGKIGAQFASHSHSRILQHHFIRPPKHPRGSFWLSFINRPSIPSRSQLCHLRRTLGMSPLILLYQSMYVWDTLVADINSAFRGVTIVAPSKQSSPPYPHHRICSAQTTATKSISHLSLLPQGAKARLRHSNDEGHSALMWTSQVL